MERPTWTPSWSATGRTRKGGRSASCSGRWARASSKRHLEIPSRRSRRARAEPRCHPRQGGTKVAQEFDGVCLGGGVGGEAVAEGLKDSGLTLAVVERELVGGECPYWGCVPSKTLRRSGETLSEAGRARVLAASRVDWTVDFPKISTRAEWMARNHDDRRAAAAMEANGATLVRGEGRLSDSKPGGGGGGRLGAGLGGAIGTG